MAVSETARIKAIHTLLAALALLAVFALAAGGLQRDSLWDDEAFTLWVVRDDARPPQGIADAARAVTGSLRSALERTRADVHPPLYFALMDAWTLAAGDSVLAARLPAALAALTGAAATGALGAHLFGRRAGLLALGLLGTSGFFIYYAREARMYALLLALAALSTLAYSAWRRRAGWRRGLLWGVLAALLVYTHYAGALVIAAQALHALLTRGGLRMLLPLALTGALFAPWLPVLVTQMRAHGGPAALPVDTATGAVALWLVLTGSLRGLYALALIFGAFTGAARRRGMGLIALWLLLTPAALLALNQWVAPLFQLRYAIAIVPAWALLLAASLIPQPPRRMEAGRRAQRGGGEVIRAALALVLIAAQVETYGDLWPPKPRWDAAAQQVAAARDPLEPALVGIAPQSPAAYYARVYGFAAGLALDIGWRWNEPDAMRAHADRFGPAPRVWLLARSLRADTWDALAALLAQGRGVGYRDTVMDTVFYRFDADGGEALRWRFGDALVYTGGIGHQWYAHAGEPFCFDLPLAYQSALPAGTLTRLTLTQGYDTVRAAADVPLPQGASGDDLTLAVCIPLPADSPPGPHHLRVQMIANGTALPLLEGVGLYWGDTLFVASVSVSAQD